MPLENFEEMQTSIWATWRIAEDERTLLAQIDTHDEIPANITNANKRLEFLAGRVLVKELLQKWNLAYSGLMKDNAGKPFFRNHSLQLSLSHSYPYVAAIIHKHTSAGIDLEQPKEKLLKIASRVMSEHEQHDAGNNITKHCIYWCAKESMIKIYGKKHLVLAEQLIVEPFELAKSGTLSGNIIADDIVKKVKLQYRVYDNFVLVYNL